MPDIQLRFHKDMLVLSAPPTAALRARGFDAEGEQEILLATEPETILEPMRLESIAGAQCLVLPTAGITRARLAHVRAEDGAPDIAGAALAIAAELTPQHVLAEIGPTRLPLDATSKTSLMANRDEYANAARLFPPDRIDAFFLNDMADSDDMRCALMGVRKVGDTPIFASVRVDAKGNVAAHPQPIEEVISVCQEYGANVVGVQTDAPVEQAADIISRVAKETDLPILVQLDVPHVHSRDPLDGSPYWCADLCMQAVLPLRQAGTQFLRACGQATASYTGALVAASLGLDSVR